MGKFKLTFYLYRNLEVVTIYKYFYQHQKQLIIIIKELIFYKPLKELPGNL